MLEKIQNLTEVPRIDIVVATDKVGGIGLGGDLPWRLEKEWQHFLKLVTR